MNSVLFKSILLNSSLVNFLFLFKSGSYISTFSSLRSLCIIFFSYISLQPHIICFKIFFAIFSGKILLGYISWRSATVPPFANS
jgi:hypothetical protein